MGWRDEATKVLKKALIKATAPNEIREISHALSSMQPYPAPGAERPMPVRVVARKSKKKWVPPKRKKKAN